MNGVVLFALIAVAGGLGAGLRFVLDGLIYGMIRGRVRGSFPWATVIINVSGSLVLGVLTGLAAQGLPHEWLLILGGGLMGGYTTFSTASVETVRLIESGLTGSALLNALGTLIVTVSAGALGIWLGTLL